MPSPTVNLRRAQTARQQFLATVDAAKRALILELTLNCGVADSEIDTPAFDGAVIDGSVDMLCDAFYHLREGAAAEEDAQSFEDVRADLADYHARVA